MSTLDTRRSARKHKKGSYLTFRETHTSRDPRRSYLARPVGVMYILTDNFGHVSGVRCCSPPGNVLGKSPTARNDQGPVWFYPIGVAMAGPRMQRSQGDMDSPHLLAFDAPGVFLVRRELASQLQEQETSQQKA